MTVPQKSTGWRKKFAHAAGIVLTAFLATVMLPGPAQSRATKPAEHPEITTLKAEFNRTAKGRELMEYARRHNITLRIDPTLSRRSNSAEYSPSTSEVLIKPGLKGEQRVIYTAHELRHGWQDKALGYAQVERQALAPQQRWLLRRFLEADAAAFSAFFAADRMEKLDLKKADYGTAAEEKNIARSLRDEFRSRDGLTGAEYLRIAFEPMLGNIGPGYTERHLTLISDLVMIMGNRVVAASTAVMKKDHATALQLVDPIMAAAKGAPDDAAIEAFLRRMGGTSFDLSVETPLQSPTVTAKKLTQDYAFRLTPQGPAAPSMELLGDTLGRLTTLSDLYKGYLRLAENTQKDALRLRETAAANTNRINPAIRAPALPVN